MLWIVAAVLVVLWICAFLVLKITGFLIHLLLLAAVVLVVLHFFKRKTP